MTLTSNWRRTGTAASTRRRRLWRRDVFYAFVAAEKTGSSLRVRSPSFPAS